MDYIISEEEFEKLLYKFDMDHTFGEKVLKDFLNSKQPVELVASRGYIFGGPECSRNRKVEDLISKLCKNNNIEIYIQRKDEK